MDSTECKLYTQKHRNVNVHLNAMNFQRYAALSMFIKLTNRKQMVLCQNVRMSIVYYILFYRVSNSSELNSAM